MLDLRLLTVLSLMAIKATLRILNMAPTIARTLSPSNHISLYAECYSFLHFMNNSYSHCYDMTTGARATEN